MSLRGFEKQSPVTRGDAVLFEDCFAHLPGRAVPGKCARNHMQNASLRESPTGMMLQFETQEELDTLRPITLHRAYRPGLLHRKPFRKRSVMRQPFAEIPDPHSHARRTPSDIAGFQGVQPNAREN